MTAAVRAPIAADWALSRGVSAFTTGDLAELLDVPPGQVRQRLLGPARRGEWVSPARGLWLPVSPEYRSWGAPPGVEVVDRLARHLGVSYYVGWLSAAELHGVAHHAPQIFQVAVSRQVRGREVGRTRLEFHHRSGVGSLPVVDHPTRSGVAHVSTVPVTAMDLAADASIAGGVDTVATALVELAEHPDFDLTQVIALSAHYPVSALRRLGWILERFADRSDLDALRQAALSGPPTPARVDPAGDLVGPVDSRWRVRVNRDVEVDL